ncbi:MAG: archease [Minisyncoccia bacterium]
MAYKFLEHTADIRMKITALNLKDVFNSAFEGLMNYLGQNELKTQGQVKRLINVSSIDLTSLLIDFLNEILTSAQIHKEIYNKINFLHFPKENDSNFFIEAEIIGAEVKNFKHDIKAITYHNANLTKNNLNQWEITIVFDI